MILVILAMIAGVLAWIAYPVFFGDYAEEQELTWPETLTLVQRSEWGNEEISNPDDIEPMNQIYRITIHHDGIPALPMKTESQIKSRVIAIRNTHSQKYADIGYHYIVDPLGRIWEGRPIRYQGAHVQGKNEGNIGILFLGNTYEDIPTQKGLDGLFSFIRYLRLRHDIDEAEVKTHRELAQTGCPGKLLQQELVKARESGKLKVKAPSGLPFDVEEVITKIEDFFKEAKKYIDAM